MSLLNPNSSTRLNQEKSKFFEIDAQSKPDGVFGCVLDDRPEVGLDIASGMIDRSEKVLIYSAALAVGSSG